METRFRVRAGIEARALTAADTGEMIAAIARNLDRLRPWFSWASGEVSNEDVRAYVADAEAAWTTGSEDAFLLWDGVTFAGSIGLYKIDRVHKIARIGYWVDAAFEGRGIIAAAVRELVTRAFSEEGLNRIEIRCAPANHASRRVPERLGFTQEGTHREVLAIHGGFSDLIMYAMLRREWQNVSNV